MGRGDGGGGAGGSESQDAWTEERFGDTARGLPGARGASGDSKLRHNVQHVWNDQKRGLLGTSTWEERAFLSQRSKLSLK